MPQILETELLILRRPVPCDQDICVDFFISERGVGGMRTPFD